MGAGSSLLATLDQSVPLNQGCVLMSAAPFARQPYRFDRSACAFAISLVVVPYSLLL